MSTPSPRPSRSNLLGSAVALAAFSFLTSAAFAGPVDIGPTRLDIARSGASTDVTLQNEGTADVSYAVRAFAWKQTPQGEVALEPTDDLIVYPQRLTIAPRQRRPIRIGYTGPLKATEGAYRIVLTELEDADASDAAGVSLSIRNRFSVPLFIAPVTSRVAIDAADASAHADELAFSLTNSGSAHAMVRSVSVRATDAAGAIVYTGTVPPWYLLPGQPRVYAVPLRAGVCERLRSLVVDATFESGAPLHATLEPKRSC